VLDDFTAALLDEETGTLKSDKGAIKRATAAGYQGDAYGRENRPAGTEMIGYDDEGGASRYFYVAKPSPSERNEGLEDRTLTNVNDGRKTSIDNPYQRGDTPRHNTHPTVKPVELMRYLVRLITPPGGTVIDPFMGSGTTGIACELEGKKFVGIELDNSYCEIAVKRMTARCLPLLFTSSSPAEQSI
jgi:site-specific DNA-methyltransferase (adenine-specific)